MCVCVCVCVCVCKIVQLKWSPIAKCLSQKFYETRIESYKREIKTIVLIFSVPKSQNSNGEEKNYITAKAYLKKSYFVNEI